MLIAEPFPGAVTKVEDDKYFKRFKWCDCGIYEVWGTKDKAYHLENCLIHTKPGKKKKNKKGKRRR